MSNTVSGLESFQPATTVPTELRDLKPLYFRLDEEMYSVAQALDLLFFQFIQQYIKVDFEDGATNIWAPEERLEAVALIMNSKPNEAAMPLYHKGVQVDG